MRLEITGPTSRQSLTDTDQQKQGVMQKTHGAPGMGPDGDVEIVVLSTSGEVNGDAGISAANWREPWANGKGQCLKSENRLEDTASLETVKEEMSELEVAWGGISRTEPGDDGERKPQQRRRTWGALRSAAHGTASLAGAGEREWGRSHFK